MIGAGIELVVIRVSKTTVKLGLQAPDGTRIMRGELLVRPPWCLADASHPCLGITKRQIEDGACQCRACHSADPPQLPK